MQKAVSPSPELIRFLRSRSLWFCYHSACPERPRRYDCSLAFASRRQHSTRDAWPSKVPSRHWQWRDQICINPVDLAHTNSNIKRPYLSQRSFTTSKHSGIWKLFGRKKRQSARKDVSDTDSPLSSFLDESAGLGRIAKPMNELKLRCTEFDENGKVTLMNGEFKKSELIAKYGLLPRDLRKIDSSLLPHILVRPSAILVNLLHLRVLIQHNRVLVFDVYGSTDSYNQSVFMYDLEGRLRQKDTRQAGALPYEFRALEAILISVTSGLEGEFEGVREPVVRVLRELEEDIDRYRLRYLLIYSKKLGTFEQKARLVRNAIDDLLEADDDLASMYLTEKANGKTRSENDHTEVEMLLESYHKVTDEIVQASENLVSNIRNTEEIVKAILDANRNALMLLDLKFSIGTLGLGAGTFIAALYGMNLTNFLEESSIGFGTVSLACAALTFAVCFSAMKRLRRVQRIRMRGETGSHHYLPSSSHHHQPYSSLTPTSRALETPVTAALVGKNGGVAAAIAEKKAERMKSAKKAAAAAAAAAATATVTRSRARAGVSEEGRAVTEENATATPAFGPRYGDPQSRFRHQKRSPIKTSDADDAGSSTLGRDGRTATTMSEQGTAELKGSTVVLSSDKLD